MEEIQQEVSNFFQSQQMRCNLVKKDEGEIRLRVEILMNNPAAFCSICIRPGYFRVVMESQRGIPENQATSLEEIFTHANFKLVLGNSFSINPENKCASFRISTTVTEGTNKRLMTTTVLKYCIERWQRLEVCCRHVSQGERDWEKLAKQLVDT
eukprot:TRINITY_DN2197_c0_g1_i1.p1 TRINITY_DN2197_c0_g1~~TRINITY_DN2197_c0_g1_i1.p1  ORF type:complete len:154 (+),score=25.04 TRINITY_DN2197_c0_g1_i1:48-509(+)